MREVTLAILAGGQGTRMGFPKQQLQISNRPILQYLIERFAWAGPTLLITAADGPHPPGADSFDAVAADAVPNQGPLRGVLTALQHATTSAVVINIVDMPAVEPGQLNWLIDRLMARADLAGLMLQRTVAGKIQIEPFPFACRKRIAPCIAQRLEQGRRSLHSLLDSAEFAVEHTPEHWPITTWTNLNFPEDLQTFLRVQR
jgi:molybdopterin-guanine dinucleotide biosynthesis protein A